MFLLLFLPFLFLTSFLEMLCSHSNVCYRQSFGRYYVFMYMFPMLIPSFITKPSRFNFFSFICSNNVNFSPHFVPNSYRYGVKWRSVKCSMCCNQPQKELFFSFHLWVCYALPFSYSVCSVFYVEVFFPSFFGGYVVGWLCVCGWCLVVLLQLSCCFSICAVFSTSCSFVFVFASIFRFYYF